MSVPGRRVHGVASMLFVRVRLQMGPRAGEHLVDPNIVQQFLTTRGQELGFVQTSELCVALTVVVDIVGVAVCVGEIFIATRQSAKDQHEFSIDRYHVSVVPLVRHALRVISVETTLGRAVVNHLFFRPKPPLELLVKLFLFGPLCVVLVRRRTYGTIVALERVHCACLSAGVIRALVVAEARVQN